MVLLLLACTGDKADTASTADEGDIIAFEGTGSFARTEDGVTTCVSETNLEGSVTFLACEQCDWFLAVDGSFRTETPSDCDPGIYSLVEDDEITDRTLGYAPSWTAPDGTEYTDALVTSWVQDGERRWSALHHAGEDLTTLSTDVNRLHWRLSGEASASGTTATLDAAMDLTLYGGG